MSSFLAFLNTPLKFLFTVLCISVSHFNLSYTLDIINTLKYITVMFGGYSFAPVLLEGFLMQLSSGIPESMALVCTL